MFKLSILLLLLSYSNTFCEELISQNDLIGKWIIDVQWQTLISIQKPEITSYDWCEEMAIGIEFIDNDITILRLKSPDERTKSFYYFKKNKDKLGYTIEIVTKEITYILYLIKKNGMIYATFMNYDTYDNKLYLIITSGLLIKSNGKY